MHRVLALVAILAVACSSAGTATPGSCPSQPTIVRVGNATLRVDVAEDDASRARGLMGMASLPPNRGMAFVWPSPTTGEFWMKDTLIPLSIAFVGEDGRVVTIREMTPCAADPCKTYAADAPYVYAVEANAGWFADHGVEVGDTVTMDRTGCS